MKFNIGDIITGVEDAPYSITNHRGIYRVIECYDNGDISVVVLDHKDPSAIGHTFLVRSKFFVYAKGYAHWEGIFVKAYNEKTFCIRNGVPVVDGVGKDSPCYKQLCLEYQKYMESKEKQDEVS